MNSKEALIRMFDALSNWKITEEDRMIYIVSSIPDVKVEIRIYRDIYGDIYKVTMLTEVRGTAQQDITIRIEDTPFVRRQIERAKEQQRKSFYAVTEKIDRLRESLKE